MRSANNRARCGTANSPSSRWRPARSRDLRLAGPQRQPLLVRVAGYSRQQHDLTIAVAEDLTALEAGLRRFQLIYGAVSAAVLAALLLVQRLIVSRGLSPIEAVRENLARLERGEAARIDAAAPAEIEPMIVELNRLLGTMDKRSRRSREALGNLAHALKTRLAILNQTAECAGAGGAAGTARGDQRIDRSDAPHRRARTQACAPGRFGHAGAARST